MRVEVVGAVETVDALGEILDGVGVNNVHNHTDASIVRSLDEVFEFLRRSKPRTRREKVAHVVAKRTVIRMLGDCHNLYGIVAALNDMRQHIVLKLLVSANALLLPRHSDMTFIDEERLVGIGLEFFSAPIELLRLPYLRCENFCSVVLDGAFHVCGQTFQNGVVGAVDDEFVQRAMHKGLGEGLVVEKNLPDAVVSAFERVLITVPIVEIAKNVHLLGSGSPFAHPPSVLVLGVIETEVLVLPGKIHEAAGVIAVELLVFALKPLVTGDDVVLHRVEPMVVHDGEVYLRFFRRRCHGGHCGGFFGIVSFSHIGCVF